MCKIEYGNTSEEYSYNNLGQVTEVNVYEGSNRTPVFSQTNNYDESGVYLGATYGETSYVYGYDSTGFVTSIGYNQSIEDNSQLLSLLEYSYYGDAFGVIGAVNSNQLLRKTYANGDTENYTYTWVSGGSKTELEYLNEDGLSLGVYRCNYNESGAMTSQEYVKDDYRQISYNYGQLDNLEKQTLTIDGLEYYLEFSNYYDNLNQRIKKEQIYSMIDCFSIDYKTLEYSYNAKGRISKIDYDSYNTDYTYDNMGRLTSRRTSMLVLFEIKEKEYIGIFISILLLLWGICGNKQANHL